MSTYINYSIVKRFSIKKVFFLSLVSTQLNIGCFIKNQCSSKSLRDICKDYNEMLYSFGQKRIVYQSKDKAPSYQLIGEEVAVWNLNHDALLKKNLIKSLEQSMKYLNEENNRELSVLDPLLYDQIMQISSSLIDLDDKELNEKGMELRNIMEEKYARFDRYSMQLSSLSDIGGAPALQSEIGKKAVEELEKHKDEQTANFNDAVNELRKYVYENGKDLGDPRFAPGRIDDHFKKVLNYQLFGLFSLSTLSSSVITVKPDDIGSLVEFLSRSIKNYKGESHTIADWLARASKSRRLVKTTQSLIAAIRSIVEGLYLLRKAGLEGEPLQWIDRLVSIRNSCKYEEVQKFIPLEDYIAIRHG